ncbi:MAG: hypothetical protein EZS28_028251 [Streblomastix strix]|uniref:Uncharacterized protein n=1 Tax=Streblomastix strix TaxID=222440 RepID=A0A5J4V1I2_9EUKA|nr:MAG: hypothetical protein EZS28_028251 [Streblomastix strix]
MNQRFTVLTLNRLQNSITSALVKNHGEKQTETTTQIVSKQRCIVRVSDDEILQQSPYGDDLQLFPQDTLALPFSHPIISTQSIVEARSPNDSESTRIQELQIQMDYQDDDPQYEAQNSNIKIILINQQLLKHWKDE